MIAEQLSHYRILNKLGAGGMGEVYRARDERLGRDVALKLLPAEFAQNADRLRRFEQEARATSALNHPNILTIYDIGTATDGDGTGPFIVMELLEGEELRALLKAGAIAPRRAVEYARQIASGLAAAHAKGIVHRDLKPENLFLTTDGRVKILDFGLAKLRPPQTVVDSDAPTQKQITNPGAVLGTVGYMSPEQVRGQEVDHRSDIFSFGVILYEMLVGHRPFAGASAVEVMNAILKEEPRAFEETNAKVSPQLEKIVRRCLEKQPEHRFHSAHDLGFALEALSTPSGPQLETATALPAMTASPPGPGRLLSNARLWMAVAALVTLASAPMAVKYLRQSPSAEPVAVRFTLNPLEKATSTTQIALSPDGRSILFSATLEGKTQLWLRPLGSVTARPLPGTEGTVGFPFWSPDSRSIGFRVNGQLKKMDLTDGTQLTLCNLSMRIGAFGGTWNSEGTILFFFGNGIYRVPATGGEPALVPGFDQSRQDIVYRWPYFLPDGRHFLYLVTTTQQEKSEVYLASLDGKEQRRLLAANSNAIYAPSPAGGGYLLFARDGALLAQPFDASRLTLTGEPFRLADQVRVHGSSRGFFSASDNGTLVYDPSGASDNQQLTWVDRAGKRLATVGAPGAFDLLNLSPDEKQVVVLRRDSNATIADLYVVEVGRGASTRLTSEPASVVYAIWSPDGNRIVWASHRGETYQFYQKLASGAGQEELLFQSKNLIAPFDWSADGSYILYTDFNPKTRHDIWVLPLAGDRKPFPFLQTPAAESRAVFSPDGRWIAYRSDETGGIEVYVQTFPASGGKWPVSTKGGLNPRWRRDGKELFYITTDGKMMSVEVKTGSTFEPGIPKALFDFSSVGAAIGSNYAVTADGQRFLFASQGVNTTPSSLMVVVNWTAEVKR